VLTRVYSCIKGTLCKIVHQYNSFKVISVVNKLIVGGIILVVNLEGDAHWKKQAMSAETIVYGRDNLREWYLRQKR